ncbi:MAG: hypothetical protein FWG10_14155 [Eubacteriaceae bacterium]|nr:hypothetical protein [Eubacteriaceae bacterium]
MVRKCIAIPIIVVICIFFASCSDEKPQAFTIPGDLYGNFDGKKKISLDELNALAEKENCFPFEDLALANKRINLSSTIGNYNMLFSVQGGYRLHALAGQPWYVNILKVEQH